MKTLCGRTRPQPWQYRIFLKDFPRPGLTNIMDAIMSRRQWWRMACVPTLIAVLSVQAQWPANTAGQTSDTSGRSLPTKPNRTLPNVPPPKTVLEFSTQPTTDDICRARIFQVPLAPVGGEPTAAENAALAEALFGYAKRNGPDDFASLTRFLEEHPDSPWRPSLLTGLGFEYYNTAHYSLAVEAWRSACEGRAQTASTEGAVLVARAREELALLYARVGRMGDLERLLKATRREAAA